LAVKGCKMYVYAQRCFEQGEIFIVPHLLWLCNLQYLQNIKNLFYWGKHFQNPCYLPFLYIMCWSLTSVTMPMKAGTLLFL
jgi:hypothetical protein